jgi:hypothetical protein
VGHFEPTDLYSVVRISGNFAYLARGYVAETSVFDVSDPTNPALVGKLPCGNDVAFSGDYAYLPSGGSGLAPTFGLFVCQNTPPLPSSSTNLVDTHYDAAVQAIVAGNYLYLAAFNKGGREYWTFEISDPAHPAFVQTNYGPFISMAISGNYGYGVSYSGMAIYDLSDPTNALVVGSSSQVTGTLERALTIYRGYLYCGGYGGIEIASLGVPPSPQLQITATVTNTVVLSWPTPAAAFAVQQSASLSSANWVTVTDRSVVVAGRNQVVLPAPNGTMFYRLVSE